MKYILYKTVLISITVLFLISCQSSDSDKDSVDLPEPIITEVNNDEVTTVVEPISCNGKIPLTIINVQHNGTSTSLLSDGNFTSQSQLTLNKEMDSVLIELSSPALVKGISIKWHKQHESSYFFEVETSIDNSVWISNIAAQQSSISSLLTDYIELNADTVKYLNLKLNNNNQIDTLAINEIEIFGCEQDTENTIELDDWYLSVPSDNDNNGKSDSIYENELSESYFNPSFYFQNSNGGITFRAPISGAKTSENTNYTRSELREMLRKGNTNINTQGINDNNWVFSSAPQNEQDAAGGVDGTLNAKLMVDHVTITGNDNQVGRVIIGQIHANDDEPIRLYYRKLPNNTHGSIYAAHEILDGDDIYYELIGTRSQSASNPEDGIQLGEIFDYQINVEGNQLTVTVTKENQTPIIKIVDMTDSGYDQGGQYMYFKAGVYNQNNTGDDFDYVQATFFIIENSHQ
jgi:hypothetical protein